MAWRNTILGNESIVSFIDPRITNPAGLQTRRRYVHWETKEWNAGMKPHSDSLDMIKRHKRQALHRYYLENTFQQLWSVSTIFQPCPTSLASPLSQSCLLRTYSAVGLSGCSGAPLHRQLLRLPKAFPAPHHS